MGVAERVVAGLGVGWIQKLLDRALSRRREDRKEITDLINVDIDQFKRLYIEPDFQPYNPANAEDDEEDEVESKFRIAAYEWLDSFLVDPKRKDGRHVAFILSDAGMGKTSLLAMLKLSSMSIPTFWPGMNFKLLKLGPSTLDDIKGLESTMAMVQTVLLLDSLDEDPAAFGRIDDRLEEILRATQEFRQVIVTCRTQFFPLQNTFERNGARIKIGGFTCRIVYLALFSEDQCDAYLAKVFPKRPSEMSAARKLIQSMKSLRMRPMLLAHVEDLMERSDEVEEWVPFTIHRALVETWLDREERKKKGVKAEELREACRMMAIHLQRSGDRTISVDGLALLLARESVPDAIRNVQEFGGRSLLNLNSDGEYRFAHYSIQEFLVVDHMAKYPERMAEYSGQVRYSEELVEFLRSFSNLSEAQEWKANLSVANLSRADLSRANLIQADLNRADFSDARLVGANLSEADLSEADLHGALLFGANLRGVFLLLADLHGANLSEAVLIEAKLAGANLNAANLSAANLNAADLSGANLRGAKLIGADLIGANLIQADLSEADLSEADLRGACLIPEQLAEACGDERTRLPEGFAMPDTWPCYPNEQG